MLGSWLGYSKEELRGKSIESILTLASRIFYSTHFFPLIRLHSKVEEIFLSLRSNDNRDLPVLANAHQLGDGSDTTIHCVFLRMEQRKKLEQEILEAKRQAENAHKENKHLAELTTSLEKNSIELEKQYQYQRMINEDLLQFSKIISHDLQEPIHKIQVFADLLANDGDTILSTRTKMLPGKITNAAARLKTITESLENYIAVDKLQVFTEVDLNAVIEIARLRAATARQFFDFEINTEHLPVVEGDGKQLELLFFHLIDNAIQFRDPSRKLEIKISQVTLAENVFRLSENQYKYADHVRVLFEDNGIGFQDEYNSYVFVLLKKIHNSSGLGVDLSLVKKIVQNHFGQVRVKSQLGKGTQFQIELPLKIKDL